MIVLPREEEKPGLLFWAQRIMGFPVGNVNDAIFAIVARDKLVGVCIFSNYEEDPITGQPSCVQVVLVTSDKRWCTRGNLRTLFEYPFRQLGVRRLHGYCSRRNKKMKRLFNKLGFTLEGVARCYYPGFEDAFWFSMLNKECKWIDGKEKRTRTAAAS